MSATACVHVGIRMNDCVCYVCMHVNFWLFCILFHFMLAWLYANVSFTVFVLQWVTSLMSHLVPLVACHFQFTYCLNIIFTANKI